MQKKIFYYVKIAKKLESLILTGIIVPGEKIPSIRSLMSSENASRTTIIKALAELQNIGLIKAKQRSGYFVPNRAGVHRKELISLSKLQELDGHIANLLNDAPEGDLTFSSAVLDTSLLSVNHLSAIAARAARKHPAETVKLMPPPGNIRTRVQIAKRLSLLGITCSPNEVVVTAGDNSFLQNLIKIVTGVQGNIGLDQVAYFGYLQAIKTLNLNVHWIPSNVKSGFNTEYALELIKTAKISAILINPTLSNPLGYTIANNEREELVKACTLHGCTIIEDDIFCELTPPKNKIMPLKHWDKAGIVAYCGSLSKVAAPGWRIGWCLPGKHFSDVVSDMIASNFSVSSPSQLIASELLESAHFEDHLKALRNVFSQQLSIVKSIILDSFPQGTQISEPEGGYIYWITLPDNINIDGFHRSVTAKNIKISNGKLFASKNSIMSFRLCVPRMLNTNSKAAIREIGLIACNSIIN